MTKLKGILCGCLPLTLTLTLTGAPAFAQDEFDEIEAELASGSAPEDDPDDLPEIGEDDVLQVFQLQRGVYASSDLGVFLAAGPQGTGNVQPFVSIKVGVDLNDWVGVQGAFSTAYVSGLPASDADNPQLQPQGRSIKDYSLTNLGAQVVFSFRPTERLALEPMLGAGYTRASPALSDPDFQARPNTAVSPNGFHVTGGFDIKYHTLLTDFTTGISIQEIIAFTGGVQTYGSSFSFVVRYTF